MNYTPPKLYRIFPAKFSVAFCSDGNSATTMSCIAGPEASTGCNAGAAAGSVCKTGAAAGTDCSNGVGVN